MKRTRLTAATVALALSPLMVLPGLTSPTASAQAAAAPPAETRIAFTDERDQLQWAALDRSDTSGLVSAESPNRFDHGGAEGFSARPVHVGELSDDDDLEMQAYVSTEDSPEGEIYVLDDSDVRTRVTCNSEIETHPVLGPDGAVFYASDATGDWDIYMTAGPLDVEDCADWRTFNLTADLGGDQLWPTWSVHDLEGIERHTLVFSTAQPGELPDLVVMEQDVSTGDDLDPDADWSVRQLTETPGVAETQPALDPLSAVMLAFTTTEDRPDGSIRLLNVNEADTIDPWGEVTRLQSSEPTWGRWDSPDLAFTTRQNDPYGDIAMVSVSEWQFGPVQTLVATPGVAETHPALVGFLAGEDEDDVLVYTVRSQRDGGVDPETHRILDADISDALLDGSDRTVRIDEVLPIEGSDLESRVDEAGPDYSPDGGQLAFSRSTVLSSDGVAADREIWVAAADGTGARSIADISGHEPGDVDRDPAWSPDGSRIAFVREPFGEGTDGDPRVMIVDLVAESVLQVTPQDDHDAPGIEFDSYHWADADPDWSPDGSQLILRRTLTLCCEDPGPILFRPAPGWSDGAAAVLPTRAERRATNEAQLWVVPAIEAGVGVRVLTCETTTTACPPVVGRQPAWAPDDSAIVFSAQGQLVLGRITANTSTDFLVVREPITGFRAPGEPTEAGTVLSQADDPAWAVDSSEIAFSGQPIGQPDQRGIYRINPDGSAPTLVTDGRGPETEPTYQRVIRSDVSVTVTVTGSPAVINGDLTATYVVTNEGPQPATDVVLTTTFGAGASATAAMPPVGCAADGTGCTFEIFDVGETQTYVVTFRHSAPIIAAATGSVTSSTVDPDLTNNTDQAPYEVLEDPPPVLTSRADVAVKVKLDEPLGYVGGQRTATVVVRNRGPQKATAVTLRAEWLGGLVLATPAPVEPPEVLAPDCLPAGESCALGDLAPGAVQRYSVLISTLTEMTAPITARVDTTTADPVASNDVSTVVLEILQPTIRLVPAVARPGQVVLAYGENMPPGTDVLLRWDSGLVVDHHGPVTVADDGTLRTSILLVRRDFLGNRALTATSATSEFGEVTGDLLVTLRSMAPPNLVGRG